MIKGLFKDTYLLEKGLSASWLRQQTLMNNVANADTPGFKTSHVEFEDQLRSAMDGTSLAAKQTRSRHMEIGNTLESVQPRVVNDDQFSYRMDDNSVDIEEQMTEIARNQIYYTTLTTKITGQFSRLRTAIVDGGK